MNSGNNGAEVIVADTGGIVYGLDGDNGNEIWQYNSGASEAFSPVISDVDEDADLDVAFTGDNKIFAVEGNENAGSTDDLNNFPYNTTGAGGGNFSNGPAVAVMNTSAGSDVPHIVGVTNNNGTIHAVNGSNGNSAATESSNVSNVQTAPAIADLFGDSAKEVVFAGSSNNEVTAENFGAGNWIYTGATGTIQGSPAIGDVNGDGVLDVVVGSRDDDVHAINGETGNPLWTGSTTGNVDSDPSLCNLNGAAGVDVVVGSDDNNVYAFNGSNGNQIWKIGASQSVKSSPAIADLAGDGELEIAVGNNNNELLIID